MRLVLARCAKCRTLTNPAEDTTLHERFDTISRCNLIVPTPTEESMIKCGGDIEFLGWIEVKPSPTG